MHVTTAVFSEMWSGIVYSEPMSEAVERSLPNLLLLWRKQPQLVPVAGLLVGLVHDTKAHLERCKLLKAAVRAAPAQLA